MTSESNGEETTAAAGSSLLNSSDYVTGNEVDETEELSSRFKEMTFHQPSPVQVNAPLGAEGGDNHQINMRIILLGKTGAGKSTTANTILGHHCFSASSSSTSVTDKCSSEIVKKFDRKIQVIDTPGFFDTSLPQEQVEEQILECIGLSAPGPHAFILVLKISRFTEEDEKAVYRIFDFFENAVSEYFVVLFTGLDDLEYERKTFDEYILTVPKKLKYVLEKCGGRCIAFNNRDNEVNKDIRVKELISIIDKNLSGKEHKFYTDNMFREAEKILKDKEKETRLALEHDKELEYEAINKEMEEKFRELEIMILKHGKLETYNQTMEEIIAKLDQRIEELKRDKSEIQRKSKSPSNDTNKVNNAQNAQDESTRPWREIVVDEFKNKKQKLGSFLRDKSDYLKARAAKLFKQQDVLNNDVETKL